MKRAINTLLVTIFTVLCANPLYAQPTIETYGNLPSIKSMALSPTGNQLGYITRNDETEGFLLYDLTKQQAIGGARTEKIKTRYVSFAGPNHALLHASRTLRSIAIRGKLEYTAAYSYNLKKNKIRQLLRDSEDLYPFQSGIGKIIGLHKDGEKVFMPAYTGTSNPVYSIMRVDL